MTESNKSQRRQTRRQVRQRQLHATPNEEVDVSEVESTEPEVALEPEEASEEKSVVEAAREIYPFLNEWSEQQVEEWIAYNADKRSPYVNPQSEVLVYDPTRKDRPVGEWSTEELRALIKGQLHRVERRDEHIEEFRRRESVVDAWSNHEVVEYYQKGIEPRKAGTGVWVRDRTRDQRAPNSWSNAELEAWAMGEIKPHSQADSVQLAQVLKERLSLPNAGNDVDSILASYKKSRQRETAVATAQMSTANGALTPMNEAYISDTLKRYINEVKPGRAVSETAGGRAQRILDGVFAYTLKLEGAKLKAGLDLIRRHIKENRDGAFSSSYAFRFVHLLKGDAVSRRRHTNFIRLFQICTDDNKGRRQQTDIPSMLADHPESIRPMLIDYFQNHC